MKRILTILLAVLLLFGSLPCAFAAEEEKNTAYSKSVDFDSFESTRDVSRTYPWKLGTSTNGGQHVRLEDSPSASGSGDKALMLSASNNTAEKTAWFECNVGESLALVGETMLSFKLYSERAETANATLKLSGHLKGAKRHIDPLLKVEEGTLYVNIRGTMQETVQLSAGEWNRLFVTIMPEVGVYSLTLNGRSVMIDGEIEEFNLPVEVDSFYSARIGVVANQEAGTKMMLDDFSFYMGEVPEAEGDDDFTNTSGMTLTSINAPLYYEDLFQSIMADRVMGQVHQRIFYINGVKNHYDDEQLRVYPIYQEDSVIVPAQAVAKALGVTYSYQPETGKITLTSDSRTIVMTVGQKTALIFGEEGNIDAYPEIIDGVVYISAKVLAQVTDKRYFFDEATEIFSYGLTSNPFNSTKKKDMKPLFAKHFRYERPTGEEIFEAISSNPANKAHPRIALRAEEVEDVKARIAAGDPLTLEMYEKVKARAEGYYKKNLPRYSEAYLRNYPDIHKEFMDMMMVYHVEGEEKYKERSIEVLEALLKFDNYGTLHHMENDVMMNNLAYGYDLLYDYLSQETKDRIVERILNENLVENLKAFKFDPTAWEGFPSNYTNWVVDRSNQQADSVCSIIHTISILWDVLPEDVIKELYELAILSLEHVYEWSLPDGGWPENVGYWSGTFCFILETFLGISKLTGTDYSYLTNYLMDQMVLQCYYLKGSRYMLGYGDGSANIKYTYVIYNMMGYAKFTDNPALMDYRIATVTGPQGRTERLADSCVSIQDLLDYDPNFTGATIEDLKLDNFYRNIEVLTARTAYHDDAAFLGFRGGGSGLPHSHYDGGSVVYEAIGESWFMDHGKSYYDYAHMNENIASQVYTVRAEGHNTMLFRNAQDLTSTVPLDEDGNVILVQDDFNHLQEGGSPAAVLNPNGGTIAVVDEGGNKVVRIASDNSGLNRVQMLYRWINAPNQIVNEMTVSYKLKVNSTSMDEGEYSQAMALIVQEYVGNSGIDNPIPSTMSQINQISNTWMKWGVSYEQGKWMDVEMTFDMLSGTMRMVVDGEVWAQAEDLPGEPGWVINGICFQTLGRGIDYYIDDVIITAEDNEQNRSAYLLAQKNKGDQLDSSLSYMTEVEMDDDQSYAICNCTPHYSTYVSDYKRGAGLFLDKEVLVIRDEATVQKDCTYHWFAHTQADVEVAADGKTAILTQNGKRLWVGLFTDGDERLEVMAPNPFPESPQHPNEDKRYTAKLAINGSSQAGDNVAFTVMAAPLYPGQTVPAKLPEVLPLSEWSGSDRQIPKLLDGITINGEAMADFEYRNNYYTKVIEVGPGEQPAIPVIAAVDGSNAVVEQTTSVPGMAKITVSEGDYSRTYYLDFRVKTVLPPASVELESEEEHPLYKDPLPATGRQVSCGDYTISLDAIRESWDQYGSDKVNGSLADWFDDDPSTSYSVVPMDSFVDLDLGTVGPVSAVEISWAGDIGRRDYFAIQVSADGETWKTVFDDASSGEVAHGDYESYTFPTEQARYVRIVGYGNNEGGEYTNIAGLRIRK